MQNKLFEILDFKVAQPQNFKISVISVLVRDRAKQSKVSTLTGLLYAKSHDLKNIENFP